MITSEYALVDTNVLVYAADKTSPFHQPAKILRDKGEVGKTSLCVCPQVLNEFFAVVTDPYILDSNGPTHKTPSPGARLRRRRRESKVPETLGVAGWEP
jgi:predicted nucleic acid-binding protein